METPMRDILILQTGGTIDKIYPQHPGAYGFEIGTPAVTNTMARVSPHFPHHTETVCTKDSQEITAADRAEILRRVRDSTQQLVLITHGTDTMCETARYLVEAGVGGKGQGQGSNDDCGESGRPSVGKKVVVITGAFKPECMRDTDADFNVGFAMGFLQASSTPGVYVAMNGCAVPGTCAARDENGKFVDQRR